MAPLIQDFCSNCVRKLLCVKVFNSTVKRTLFFGSGTLALLNFLLARPGVVCSVLHCSAPAGLDVRALHHNGSKDMRCAVTKCSI